MKNPENDWHASRCGHNFEIADCPYERCDARAALAAIGSGAGRDAVKAAPTPREWSAEHNPLTPPLTPRAIITALAKPASGDIIRLHNAATIARED